MRILVTGADGFIGRHTVAAARSALHEVLTWKRSDAPLHAPETLVLLQSVDAVVHLAGRYPLRDQEQPGQLDLFHANASLTAELLEACSKAAVPRIVLASTATVYVPAECTTLDESRPTSAHSAYAASKLCAEALLHAHASTAGNVSLRLFNVYGPGQSAHNVFETIAAQAIIGNTVRVLDDRPVRDFVHVRDVARAFVHAATRTTRLPDVLNIGSGQGTSIRSLATHILRAAGREGRIESVHSENSTSDIVVADIGLARRTLGWEPEIQLEQGVSDTLAGRSSALATREISQHAIL